MTLIKECDQKFPYDNFENHLEKNVLRTKHEFQDSSDDTIIEIMSRNQGNSEATLKEF